MILAHGAVTESIRAATFVVLATVLVVTAPVRADAPRARTARVDTERPAPPASPAEPLHAIFGLRLLAPIYCGDVTMPGGRDYVGGTPQGGLGFRVDAALQPIGGFTLGLAVGYARNALKPQLLGDTRDVLTDAFGVLLFGYRATVADVLVIGAALGLALHVVRPATGGWGAQAELELGWRPHPRIVLGASLAYELISGMSESHGPFSARVTPALLFELLL